MTKSTTNLQKQHHFIIFSHFRPFSSAQFNIQQRHPIRKRLKKGSPMKYDESERSTKPDSISPSIAVDIFYYFFIFHKLLRYSFQEKRLKKMNLRSTFPSSLQYITLHQIVSINNFCFLLNSSIPTMRSTTIMPKL